MPSLRISFPEKESPSVVVLRGKRITIGRLPQNTIQIRDRTVSAHHAELIEEEDHYRLHDLEATNGILVNGEPVTDFHLREACKVTFGGVECEFSLEAPAESEIDSSFALLSRSESETLLTKNLELEKTITSLRAEIAELQKPVGDSKEVDDLQRLTAELNAHKESIASRERDLQQVKTDLALAHRDRMNLQRALNEAKAKPAPALAPAAATPEQAEPVERPAAVPIPAPAPKPMAEFPASKPALPKPKAPLPHATPPPATPVARPVAKPAAATPGNGNGAPAVAKPSPYAKSPVGGANPQTPKPSLATRPPTAVSGPKGTQKIG